MKERGPGKRRFLSSSPISTLLKPNNTYFILVSFKARNVSFQETDLKSAATDVRTNTDEPDEEIGR